MKYPSTFYPFFPCLYLGMVNRVFFYDNFLLIFFSIFISDFLKQIAGMIGTSILTVYQGHIRNASLKSSATAGLCLTTGCERKRRSWIRASFLGSELISFFSFYYQDQTCNICENFDNVLKCVSQCLFRIITCRLCCVMLCHLVSYPIYCVT